MTKNEFMAFSLPYVLKVKFESGEIAGYNATTYFYDKFNNENLPICRPPSDLTKPIEHNGEKFVPIDELNELAFKINPTWFMYEEDVDNTDWMLQPFFIVQQLAKWHFNLMDENETFIDVNTLETNPYK